jgi:putative ABC transport system permease protein
MNLNQALRLALRSLAAYKLRSSLTMLGLVIGVSAVILLMSIGQGVKNTITDQFNSLGTNLVFVDPGTTTSGGVRSQAGAVQTLTYEDAKAIADPVNVPSAAVVSPEVNASGQFIFQSTNTTGLIYGVTPAYGTIHNYTVASGDWISDGQLQGATNAVVLGSSVARTLFGASNPIGMQVRINAVGGQSGSFTVIGVGESKGGSSFSNPDTAVYLPLTTVVIKLRRAVGGTGTQTVSHIAVQAIDGEHIQAVEAEINALLLQRHHIADPTTADFSITSLEEQLKTVNTVTSAFTLFLGAVAGLSLLVGGIGIMNIMIVSVMERTHEIGLRKAVGARRHDLMVQFLTESLGVSQLGGLGGIVLGAGAGRQAKGSPIPIAVTPQAIVLAAGVSAVIGVVFGIYPAYRASKMSPIQALRYE